MANIQSIQSRLWLCRLQSLFAALLLGGLIGYAGAAHAGYAVIVTDSATGVVLSAVNADKQNYPASLTKMMTLYLTFQALRSGKLKVNQGLPVSAWAASRAPTKLGLRAGQTISVNDCILGMVTKSANDAASVVAASLGGNESSFADMMTAQAALLGMTSTHFANASGLPDPNNTSTARDMAKLAMALYRDFPQYAHYFATKEFVFRGQLIRGHNNLMERYPGMDGLKTGFTDASGFNLASTAVRDGRRLFAVVLGGRSASARDQLMARLLDDGFDNQSTPEALVAQAGVSSTTGRMLAALSPIGTAEANETVPAQRRAHVRTQHRGKSYPRTAKSHGKSTTRLAHRHKAKKVVLASSGHKKN